MHIQVVWWTKWNLFARTIHFAWANSLNGSWWVWLLKSALNMLILPVSIHSYAHDKLIPTSFIEASLHVVTQKALCRNNTHTIVMKVFRTNVYMQLGHCINYFNVRNFFERKFHKLWLWYGTTQSIAWHKPELLLLSCNYST